jgi:hypothetical protein
VAELALSGGWIAAVLVAEDPLVSYHVGAMALGQMLTASSRCGPSIMTAIDGSKSPARCDTG